VTTLQYLTLADPSNPAQPRHLAYYEWGDADDPDVVLCVHGLSRNGRDFDFLAQALSARCRVVCPDMAGRGKSDWLVNKADYTYATYLADINALLAHLALDSVAWVGTSMGGILGMMLAAEQPQRIRRMVLNDVGKIVSVRGLRRIRGYVGASGQFASAEEALAYLRIIAAPFGITTEAAWRQMFAASFTELPGGRYALAYDPGISQPLREQAAMPDIVADIDLSALWNAVQCPVLLLHGKDSDILTHEVAQAMCARAIPTRLIEFDNTGHAPALLEESRIAPVVDWLQDAK
jgi:pimeloyl-ACP methyl ester carboxylesterase